MVTATLPGVAALPKLSVAVIEIVSVPADASESVRVARSAFTCASEPLSVRLVVPEPEIPPPEADSSPVASLTTTVKVSAPVVLPLSETLIAVTGLA